MLKLLLASLLAVSITGCMGAGDGSPTPTVMGEETGPGGQGPSEPGATVKPQPPDNYP
jgi:hypothetical protein